MNKRKKLNLFLIVMFMVGVSVSLGCISGGGESHTEAYNITSKTPPEDVPTGEVGEPVKVGVKDYKGTRFIEVTVLEYVRGEKANRMINDTNRFNDKPKPGYEYLLVRVRVKYIKGPEELRVSSFYFKAFSGGVGRKYSWIVMPDSTPKLESVEIVPGGEVDGWIAFEVVKNTEVQLKYYPKLLNPAVSIRIPGE